MRFFRTFSVFIPIFICLGMYGVGIFFKIQQDAYQDKSNISSIPCRDDQKKVQVVTVDFGGVDKCYRVQLDVSHGIFFENIYGPLVVDTFYSNNVVQSDEFSSLSTFEGRFVHVNTDVDVLSIRVRYFKLINFSQEPRIRSMPERDIDYLRFSNFYSNFLLPLVSCLFLYFVAAFFLRMSFLGTEFLSYRYASLGAVGFSTFYFITLFPSFAVSFPWFWQFIVYSFAAMATWSFCHFLIVHAEIEVPEKVSRIFNILIFSWLPLYFLFGYIAVSWIDLIWINFYIFSLIGLIVFVYAQRGWGYSVIPAGLAFSLLCVIFDWLFLLLGGEAVGGNIIGVYWGPMGLMILFYIIFFDFFFKLSEAYRKNRNSHKVLMSALKEQREELHAIYLARSEDELLKSAWNAREILARDLHDIVGSKLSLVILLLLKGGVPRSLLIQQIKQCLVDMRSLIMGAAAGNAELLYVKFISDYRDAFQAMGLDFGAIVVGDALTSIRSIDLSEVLKIFRELITNVVKYEAPQSVRILISAADELVTFKLTFSVNPGRESKSRWFADVSGGMGDELIAYRLRMISAEMKTVKKADELIFLISISRRSSVM